VFNRSTVQFLQIPIPQYSAPQYYTPPYSPFTDGYDYGYSYQQNNYLQINHQQNQVNLNWITSIEFFGILHEIQELE
jgi:hypothetical protein